MKPNISGRRQQWQPVVAKQCLCLADLVADDLARNPETISTQRFLQIPRYLKESVYSSKETESIQLVGNEMQPHSSER